MIAEMKRAIELDTTNPEYYNTMGYFYLIKNNYDLAIDNFKKALELAPEYKEVNGNMAYVLGLTGKSSNDKKMYFQKSGNKVGMAWGDLMIKKETNKLVDYLNSISDK